MNSKLRTEITKAVKSAIWFQEKKEKILSSNKLYYPISRRICLLLIILGITGVVSFIAGLHDILVLPILLLIGGVGMKRTVDLAAMERAIRQAVGEEILELIEANTDHNGSARSISVAKLRQKIKQWQGGGDV